MTTLFRTVARGLLVIGLVAALTACGRGRATPTPAPAAAPTDTPVAAAPAAAPTAAPTDTPVPVVQAESPLVQAESPLAQPVSPLTTMDGKEIVTNPSVPVDRGAIVNIVASTTAPAPQEGMAAVSAVLFSHNLNQTIPSTMAYLTPADVVDGQPEPPSVYLGPDPEEGDLIGQTTPEGRFLLDNVPPGNYYLVVWSVYDWPAAFTLPSESMPVLVSVEAGDQLDLGLLYVNWP